jgi:hypothetical protein
MALQRGLTRSKSNRTRNICALVMANEGARFLRPKRAHYTDTIALWCDVSVFRALIAALSARVPTQIASGVWPPLIA